MQGTGTDYPATLSIEYAEKLSRMTTFFRLIVAIPILIIIGSLSANGAAPQGAADSSSFNPNIGAGFVFVPLILMILFRRKYPKWWFDWNLAFTRFSTRIAAYLLLLRDDIPPLTKNKRCIWTSFIRMPLPNSTVGYHWSNGC